MSGLAQAEDRALEFVAAPAAAADGFDSTTGAVLLALAGLAAIVAAVLLLTGIAAQRRASHELDRVERALEDTDG